MDVPQETPSTSGFRRRGELLFWGICLAASFHLAQGFAFSLSPAFSIQAFAYGQVESPYRRRILMEWVYRAYLHLHGDGMIHLGKRSITPEQQILFLIAFFGALLTVVLTRWMIVRLLGHGTPFRWLSLAALYMLSAHELLITDIRAQFPYDLTTALFFGTGMFAAVLRNRWFYYAAFLLGTFNRETTMFLPLVFLITSLPEDLPLRDAWKRLRPLLVLEAIAQIVVWQAIVSFCEKLTGGHGKGMKMAWHDNISMLANPTHWPLYLSIFGFLWIPMLLYLRRIPQVGLRRCALLLPLWWLVMFFVGDPLEIRLYNEWIPFMTTCLAIILSQSIRFIPSEEIVSV